MLPPSCMTSCSTPGTPSRASNPVQSSPVPVPAPSRASPIPKIHSNTVQVSPSHLNLQGIVQVPARPARSPETMNR